MDESTRIKQTLYLLNIEFTSFSGIITNEAGASININNVNAKINNCFVSNCCASTGAAIYSINCYISLVRCCFSYLSANLKGNGEGGIVVDLSNSPISNELCSTYKCAESVSLGADSTYVIRNSLYYFSQINFSECHGHHGGCTCGENRGSYGSLLKSSTTTNCTNTDLIEFNSTIFLSNFINCNVEFCGYMNINFTRCFFQGISNLVDDPPVYYFECEGQFPGSTVISKKSIALPLVKRDVCMNKEQNFECSKAKPHGYVGLSLNFFIWGFSLGFKCKHLI